MITGSNTNVRHGGRVFHVQTEDSGRGNPHVISHLYFGGTILASEKTTYAERVREADPEALANEVRELIEQQHQSMLEKLRSGKFDAVIAERLGHTTDPVETSPTREPAAPPTKPAIDPAAGKPAATPAPRRPAASEPAPSSPAAGAGGRARAFGEGIVSQKPLDEVILEYLVEKSRSRGSARTKKADAAHE